jgi:predicted RNA polymerase sigma factor
MAKTFSETRWERILSLYNHLGYLNPSPAVLLNRAIASGKVNGPDVAIEEINRINDIAKLIQTHYLFSSVLGDLYRQQGNKQEAEKFFRKAVTLTNSNAGKRLLQKKLKSL